jgi:HNH endonuclease
MRRLPDARILSGSVTALGYVAFNLRDPDTGKSCRRLAHRLVATAFIPNPFGLSDVAHQDGNPSNNSQKNLRWSTHRDNQMDMRAHGTMQDGEKCVTAKLTAEQVRYIRATCPKGRTGRQLAMAREFGVSKAVICNIVNRKLWKHLD